MPENNVQKNPDTNPEVDTLGDIDGIDEISSAQNNPEEYTDTTLTSDGADEKELKTSRKMSRGAKIAVAVGAGATAILTAVGAAIGVASGNANTNLQNDNEPTSTSGPATPGQTNESPDNTESPSPSETQTNKEWLPSRGDILRNPSRMTDAELRQACAILENDPDSKTPEGIANQITYRLTRLINNTYDEELLIKQYGTDDGQLSPEKADQYARETSSRMYSCLNYMFNNGESYHLTTVEFGLSINANRLSMLQTDPSMGSTELYKVDSAVQKPTIKYHKETGEFVYTSIETSNFDKSFGPVVNGWNPDNPRFKDNNPCKTTHSFKVIWQGGKLIMSNYSGKAVCENS